MTAKQESKTLLDAGTIDAAKQTPKERFRWWVILLGVVVSVISAF